MIPDLKPYPAMKDSGVDTLGAVPAHWEVTGLGRLGRLFKGRGASKEDEALTGIPCIRYGDLYTRYNYFIHDSRACIAEERASDYTPIEYGDVLFAASGETIDEIGKSAVNLIKGEAYCGGDVIIFRPSQRIDSRYMGYVTDFRPAAIQKARMGRGFTVIHIYGDELKRLAVPLPPVPEQAAIARFLDYADRHIQRYIHTKQKLIALLEEQKQAVIHEAVTGRIDVRTGKPYSDYKPSGIGRLGDVPAHWELLRFGRLITLDVGFPFRSEDFTQAESDMRLLRGINVAPGRLRWDDVVRWPAINVEAFSEYLIEMGDIVLGMDRPIIGNGVRVAVASEADAPSLLLQRVARIRPVEKRLLREFALRLLGSKGFSDYLAPIFTGISVPHLSPEQIREFRIALPGMAEQRAIIEYANCGVHEAQSATDRAQRQIDLLQEYRTKLIADVVTGKLDVRAAAAALPEEPDDPDAAEGDCPERDDARGDLDRRTVVPATQEAMTS